MAVKKKSLSYYILLSLEKAVDGYVRFEDFTYHHYRYHYGIPDLKQSELSQALKRLRERGLVIEDKINVDKVIFKLTQLGQDTLGLEFNEKDWDGKWRVVIFDIPEERKSIRNQIRKALVSVGFMRLQDSVWVYPYDCEDFITLLKADFKIGKEVLYMIVEELEYDKPVKSYFGFDKS